MRIPENKAPKTFNTFKVYTFISNLEGKEMFLVKVRCHYYSS